MLLNLWSFLELTKGDTNFRERERERLFGVSLSKFQGVQERLRRDGGDGGSLLIDPSSDSRPLFSERWDGVVSENNIKNITFTTPPCLVPLLHS